MLTEVCKLRYEIGNLIEKSQTKWWHNSKLCHHFVFITRRFDNFVRSRIKVFQKLFDDKRRLTYIFQRFMGQNNPF
jgi:poly-beta-hydroxyalkanoate depolymerase